MRKMWFALAVAVSSPVVANAQEMGGNVAPEVQFALQSALQSYIDDVFSDGALTFIEVSSGELLTVYPASVHPMIVPFGSDYFLCSEVVTDAGTMVTADFLLREIDGQFRVVQRLIGQRDVLEMAMSQL